MKQTTQKNWFITYDKSKYRNDYVYIIRNSKFNIDKDIAFGERAEFQTNKQAEDFLKEIEKGDSK